MIILYTCIDAVLLFTAILYMYIIIITAPKGVNKIGEFPNRSRDTTNTPNRGTTPNRGSYHWRSPDYHRNCS